MTIDRAAADELLTTTRAVRKRLDMTRPVPRDVIVDCVRISQQAPIASNRQDWRWIIVDDAEKRAAVAKIYREITGTLFENLGAKADSAQTARVYDSALYLTQHLHEVPVLVIPCMIGRVPAQYSASLYSSIYPAVWSFQLALRARGLGTVLTTAHLLRETDVAAVLGIPEDVVQAAILPVAYTIGDDFKPADRPPPESIIHWNGW
jgi:nitroreductase